MKREDVIFYNANNVHGKKESQTKSQRRAKSFRKPKCVRLVYAVLH